MSNLPVVQSADELEENIEEKEQANTGSVKKNLIIY